MGERGWGGALYEEGNIDHNMAVRLETSTGGKIKTCE